MLKGEEDLTAALGALQLAEFIYEQPAAGDVEYTFKHALTQEVAYHSVLSDRRQLLHERAAAAIEALGAGWVEDHLTEVAHHSRHIIALASGDLPAASALADQALDLAVREGSPARLGLAHFLQLETRYERGDLAGTEEHFTTGLAFFAAPGFRQFPGYAVFAFGVASWNAWALGRADVARDRMAQAMVAADTPRTRTTRTTWRGQISVPRYFGFHCENTNAPRRSWRRRSRARSNINFQTLWRGPKSFSVMRKRSADARPKASRSSGRE